MASFSHPPGCTPTTRPATGNSETRAPSVPLEKHHFEFLSDPERARAYLEVALEEYARDQDKSALLLALKDVASARGGLGRLARRANLNRSHVYRALSAEGNPRLDTMEKILNSLGFRLSIEPLAKR